MHDPKNFEEPDRFIPDRFYKNGEFVNDIRVVTFSLGLRNCIGKQIAIDEYFVFATNIIRDFQLSRFEAFLNVFHETIIQKFNEYGDRSSSIYSDAERRSSAI